RRRVGSACGVSRMYAAKTQGRHNGRQAGRAQCGHGLEKIATSRPIVAHADLLAKGDMTVTESRPTIRYLTGSRQAKTSDKELGFKISKEGEAFSRAARLKGSLHRSVP